MSAWRTLAEDQVFWATVATSATAALIAVVLEGRTAREEYDRRRLDDVESHRRDWGEWEERFARYRNRTGPDPGHPPPQLVPSATPRQARDRTRALLLVVAVWALALAMAGALLAASPAAFPGALLAGVGCMATLLALAVGVGALVWAATVRIWLG
jgi:hypothetical protein